MCINYKKEFEKLRRQAKDTINDYGTHEGYMLYVSGTPYGIRKMKALLEKYNQNMKLDAELGVIDEKQAVFEKEVYELLKYSIDRAKVY